MSEPAAPILIGMFDSPFVRRVAVSMRLLGIGFEHRSWSVGRDARLIREFNPLGRVPALLLEDGSALIDSAAILDTLDERVGPDRALLPVAGKARRDALQLMALATGAADKALQQVFETFRPQDKRHHAWISHCRRQVNGALTELERRAATAGGWLVADRMTQADVTVACALGFIREATETDLARWPTLAALSGRCEALPEFAGCRLPFARPATA